MSKTAVEETSYRSDLITHVADIHDISKAKAEAIIKTVFTSTAASIVKHGTTSGFSLRIFELGTFSAKAVAARDRRNPATGETAPVAAHVKVAFKLAKKLKDLGKPGK